MKTKLSFSRISCYVDCPRAYYFRYIDDSSFDVVKTNQSIRLGSAVHGALHAIVQTLIRDELPDVPDEAVAMVWKEVAGRYRIFDIEQYSTGLSLVQVALRKYGKLSYRDVLAVEKHFLIDVGKYDLHGYMDRVDYVGSHAISVIDYKTNHQLYSQCEVDSSLQLSIYHLAAKTVFPWATSVDLEYWMLRHGISQRTSRTDADDAFIREYVTYIGDSIAADETFEPSINPNCAGCFYNFKCDAYRDAAQLEYISPISLDIDAASVERESVAARIKILNGIKEKLDSMIRTSLSSKEVLTAGGRQYRIINIPKRKYEPGKVLDVLRKYVDSADMVSISDVDEKRLMLFVDSAVPDKAKAAMCKLELEESAQTVHYKRMTSRKL